MAIAPIGPNVVVNLLRQKDPANPDPKTAKLAEELASRFPAMQTDLTSYLSKGPTCGCAGRLMRAIAAAPEPDVQKLLDDVYGADVYKFDRLLMPQQLEPIIGMAATIDATPEAWGAYFTALRKHRGPNMQTMYHGVHVKDLPDGKWLLLFY